MTRSPFVFPSSLRDEDPVPPPRFEDAMEIIGEAMARCEGDGIPRDSLLAAALSELMPRLVAAFGRPGTAAVLGHILGEIVSLEQRLVRRQ